MKTTYIDLVLDNGELVRIEVPSKFEDEAHDSLENAMKIGEWWCPHRFEGASASFMGMSLDRVSMKRVVATL
jgi:hypothetical protein